MVNPCKKLDIHILSLIVLQLQEMDMQYYCSLYNRAYKMAFS